MRAIALKLLIIFIVFNYANTYQALQKPEAKSHKLTATSLERKTYAKKKLTQAQIVAKFFKGYNSNLHLFADSFVDTARRYNIDYTVLPSIAMVESSGCKNYILETNNCFGWGNGLIYFKSIDDAIDAVGSALGTGKTYKRYQDERSIAVFAKIYNPSNWQDYQAKINYFREEVIKYEKSD